MFCGNVANKDLNRIHKRALRILQNDYSSFEELLRKSNECTIRANNLQKLMFEVYKSINKKTIFYVEHIPWKEQSIWFTIKTPANVVSN